MTANVSQTTQKKFSAMAWAGVRNCCSCVVALSSLVFLGLFIFRSCCSYEGKTKDNNVSRCQAKREPTVWTAKAMCSGDGCKELLQEK